MIVCHDLAHMLAADVAGFCPMMEMQAQLRTVPTPEMAPWVGRPISFERR